MTDRPQAEAPWEAYPIRAVATLTGVKPITLRAWERRYGLIRPLRTPKGHRLYTRDDIELIQRVLTLLDRGLSISQVSRALAKAGTGEPAGEEAGPWSGLRRRTVDAVTRFDEQALEQCYEEALALHPIDLVTRQILLPVLVELGRRWEETADGIAEEHFFAVYLRNKLGARFHHRLRRDSGQRLLGACLPGEQHEIGLLLFALAAHEAGLQVTLLGANTPFEGIPTALRRTLCAAVVLSGSVAPSRPVLDQGLRGLVAQCAVPVFVGGPVSLRERDTIVAAGAQPLGTDIAAGLARLRASLPPSGA